ncbi:MAG TPA: sugar ABC transporter permease [Chloroflexota bacterium]|jgi:glucose/mannose transport system permease protein|nr:sugar ABC transporter permease [Chloroflexota bacterium]
MQVGREGRGGGLAAPRPLARPRTARIRGDTLVAILALSPSIIAVAVFVYGFILWTGYVSLVRWDGPAPDYAFVGLRNYARLFETERFLIDLGNTAIFAALFMAECVVVGFVLAVFLDQHVKGEAIFRTIYIFPFAISAVVTGVAWRWLMQPTSGINLLLSSVGLGALQSRWFADPDVGIKAVTIVAAWQMSGYVMALYLAGLRAVPGELREAAAIDGAGAFAYYRHVVLPLLAPVTFAVVVILGNVSLRLFDLTASMTSSGPAYADDTPAFFMFQTTFQQYHFAQGAAIAMVILALASLLIVPHLYSVRSEVER